MNYYISVVAIIISIISLIIAYRNNKRQLRINKIEEIIEIIHILNLNYKYFEDTEYYKNKITLNNAEESEYLKFNRQLEFLSKLKSEINLQDKLTRLYVLSVAYLPKGDLKDKIQVLITIITSIDNRIFFSDNNLMLPPFLKFPKPWEYLELTQEIQNELIEEMKLGYSENISNINPMEDKIKERYNLK